MKVIDNLIVNLNSEDPQALVAFYRDKIGLKPNPEVGGSVLMAASTRLVIGGHGELKGAAKEPQRTILNFAVDDAGKEMARLEAAGVQFLGPPSNEPISFATFTDPDGNYGQVFSMAGAPAGLEMFAVARTSEDAPRMQEFYRNVVGLSDDFPQLGNPFMAGETFIYVSPHSEVHGQAKEPSRVLLNFVVEDLAAEQKRIESHGVRFLRTAAREDRVGIVSTFPDPDGNLLRLVESRFG